MKLQGKIRVCAHCEYVSTKTACPKCEFSASYDAVWMYGGWMKAIFMMVTQLRYRQRRA